MKIEFKSQKPEPSMNEEGNYGKIVVIDTETGAFEGAGDAMIATRILKISCQGTVQPRIVKREVFKHRDGFVILEDVTIGVCDTCGNRYYSADILHAVHAVATGAKAPERTEQIPVIHLESA